MIQTSKKRTLKMNWRLRIMIDYLLLAFAILCFIIYITIINIYKNLLIGVQDLKYIYELGLAYETGRNHFKNKRRAKKIYRIAAERGHAESQFRLGVIYYNLNSVPNKVNAVKWFKMAAEQGNIRSNNYLGICYERGDGVAKNPEKAVYYYKIGSTMGDPYATRNLGVCYEYGQGVDKDLKEALNYYEKAEELGYEHITHEISSVIKKIKDQQK